MQVQISFKHLDHTEALDQKIKEKSKKLKKFFEGNIDIHWTCGIREDGKQCAEIKLIGPQFSYHASAHSENLYKSLDMVIRKIERQVSKKKSKWKAHISQKHATSFKEHQIYESEADEDFWADPKNLKDAS